MLFHSQVGMAAYLDLLRLLQDEAVSALRGAPTAVTVKGRIFWVMHAACVRLSNGCCPRMGLIIRCAGM